MIPKAIERELRKLVRDRDRWKRLAQDRAPIRSAERRREIEDRNEAVYRLLFLIAIEGVSGLTRGGRGCVYDAIAALRPDIDRELADGAEPFGVMDRHYPNPEGG